MKPISRQLAGLLLMCAGLAMTTLALALLWLAPEVFVATARIAVPPAQPAATNGTAATRNTGGAGWDATDLERIQAKVVLYQVIASLELQQKWGEQLKSPAPLPMDKAYQLLKKQMDVRQSGNPSVIEIRVHRDQTHHRLTDAPSAAVIVYHRAR